MGDTGALSTRSKHYDVCTCVCTCKSNLPTLNDSKGHSIYDLQNKLHLNRHYLNNLLKVNLQNKYTFLTSSILPLGSELLMMNVKWWDES